MHRVRQKSFEWATLTDRVLLETSQYIGELCVLLTFGQDLQAEVVVANKLLVNVEHGEQNVKQVAWNHSNKPNSNHFWNKVRFFFYLDQLKDLSYIKGDSLNN